MSSTQQQTGLNPLEGARSISSAAHFLLRAAEVAINWTVSRTAAPFSRLYVASDGSGWVLGEEARELTEIAKQLGIPARCLPRGSTRGIARQVIFHSSQWFLRELLSPRFEKSNRLAFSYFHGVPTPEHPEFGEVFEIFKSHHSRISRVQVSHCTMQNLLLETGIPAEKVKLIPIGINLSFFPLRSPESRAAARRSLGLPESAFIVGSFQKDGTGWGDGNEPKLIKGPDIFLRVLESLKDRIPELFVLLSGPSRGYMKLGLQKLGIPFHHVYLDSYPQVAELYRASDLTLVTSREEGGPKAILESMASGVPLVTTSVGQAVDMVSSGTNGFMSPINDIDSLAGYVEQIASSSRDTLSLLIAAARFTAETNSYSNQLPLWSDFFDGLFEGSGK